MLVWMYCHYCITALLAVFGVKCCRGEAPTSCSALHFKLYSHPDNPNPLQCRACTVFSLLPGVYTSLSQCQVSWQCQAMPTLRWRFFVFILDFRPYYASIFPTQKLGILIMLSRVINLKRLCCNLDRFHPKWCLHKHSQVLSSSDDKTPTFCHLWLSPWLNILNVKIKRLHNTSFIINLVLPTGFHQSRNYWLAWYFILVQLSENRNRKMYH